LDDALALALRAAVAADAWSVIVHIAAAIAARR
jgi:hypothetical protein